MTIQGALTIFLVKFGRLHAVVSQDVDQLESDCGNVLSYFHHIVFSDSKLISLPLFCHYVSSDQKSNY